ncbi:DUF885 domain-containing protein [Amycolatopsis nigrescens]|uniref:DUF885 domain-containing protein n=1 Tax=Amycolatopsis nigrescens TaxID=381445 RepID=UPI00037C4444|nr:DUF885 domain-containing protein [Amycolatopsis nigrescens]
MNAVTGLADELVEILFEAEPLWPSLLGLPGDHDRLADLSAGAAQAFRARYLDVVARAEAIPIADLSFEDSVTLDVVRQQARAAVDLIDAAAMEVAVSDGLAAPALSVLMVLSMTPLDDEAKAAGYLRRLAALPSFLDTVTERQRAALAEGAAPADFLVEAGIAYVRRYLAEPERDPLRIDAPAEGFAAERDRLLAEVVRPAYARYRDFLESEVRAGALPADRPGLCWLPDGQRRYNALIRAHTTTERSAQELHDTGLAMIEQLAGEYRELGARVFGTEELPEIFHRLRTDPELRWRDGDELLEHARETIVRAAAVAPDWFKSVPDIPCEVLPVPPAEADGGTLAYYFSPPLDGSRPGRYFANTFAATERNRQINEAVAFHEAIPGHHFQICTAQGLTELPLLRRIADVNAYTEGWGLYAERLADEMGLYSSDLMRLGMLTEDSLRAGRLVVDTGLHALGWSRRQAVDFLLENSPMAAVEIETEIDRYAGAPGQALSYMTGRLEIQRIRAAAEAALGERFDLREFHDVVLGSGILPLPVLDSVVATWVRGVNGAI